MAKRSKSKAVSSVVDENRRYFLNPESVSKHLFCSICQEVFVKPQRAPCGHSYCKECIYKWLKTSNTCPDDRKPLRKSDLHHDFILENIIGDHMVACPFRKLGCQHIGQLQMSNIHKKECMFNPDNMPDFLKEEAVESSLNKSGDSYLTDTGDDSLPEPPIPSLKMRLFAAGEKQRQLLCSMFDNKKNKSDSEPRQGRFKKQKM